LWETLANPDPPAGDVNDTELTEWQDKDDRALSQIILGVKNYHLITVSTCTSAKQAWDALEVSFSVKTSARRAQLTVELMTIHKKHGEDMHMYTSRVKALQAELATAGLPMDKNAVILYVLRVLRDEYKMIKTVLLAAPQFLAWESVMAALLPVDAGIGEKMHNDEGAKSVAYLAGQAARNEARKERRKHITCWSCNKKGHYQSECRSAREEGADLGSTKPVVFMVTGQRKVATGVATTNEDEELVTALMAAIPDMRLTASIT